LDPVELAGGEVARAGAQRAADPAERIMLAAAVAELFLAGLGGRVGAPRRGKRWEQQVKTEITRWGAAAIQIDQARKHTWVATAAHDDQGQVVVKLWPPLRGTDVAKTVSRWCESLGVLATAIAARSPSATLLEPLSRELRLVLPDGVGLATAQGQFADLLNAGRLSIIGRQELTEAARLAEVRRTAGSYALAGYAGLEPLVACQLAVWALECGHVRPFIL
jgi:hypothetical protein